MCSIGYLIDREMNLMGNMIEGIVCVMMIGNYVQDKIVVDERDMVVVDW